MHTKHQQSGILIAASIYVLTLPALFVLAALGIASLSPIAGPLVGVYAIGFLMAATELYGKDVFKAVYRRAGSVFTAVAENSTQSKNKRGSEEQ